MTVVVTGASGHVGGNLIRELIAQGRQVKAVVYKDTRALEGLEVERINADVLDPDSLNEAFAGADVVYHLAALISITGSQGGRVERINVEGPRAVAAACLARGVKRLIHFSSIHAFQQIPQDEPLDETRPKEERETALTYDRTKALGEKEIRAAVERGLDAVIVNPTAVLGPHDYKPSRMGKVIFDLYRRKMPSLVPGGFDWVDVRDVVQGAIAAETKGRTGENYLLGGHFHSITELAALVEEITGVKAPGFTSPMWLARVGTPFVWLGCKMLGQEPLYTGESLRVLRESNHMVSHEKAEKELGYHARPLRETLETAIQWFQEAQSLNNDKS